MTDETTFNPQLDEFPDGSVKTREPLHKGGEAIVASFTASDGSTYRICRHVNRLGQLLMYRTFRNDQPHSFADHPAHYDTYPQEDIRQRPRVKLLAWMVEGQQHRDGAPAAIYFDTAGYASLRQWYQNGKLHRDPAKGPAFESTLRDLPQHLVYRVHGEKPKEGIFEVQYASDGDKVEYHAVGNGMETVRHYKDGEFIFERTQPMM